jgi:hypothetical protein
MAAVGIAFEKWLFSAVLGAVSAPDILPVQTGQFQFSSQLSEKTKQKGI